MQKIKQTVSTILKNALKYPGSTAKGIIIFLGLLGVLGANWAIDSAETQDSINQLGIALGAIAALLAGAHSK